MIEQLVKERNAQEKAKHKASDKQAKIEKKLGEQILVYIKEHATTTEADTKLWKRTKVVFLCTGSTQYKNMAVWGKNYNAKERKEYFVSCNYTDPEELAEMTEEEKIRWRCAIFDNGVDTPFFIDDLGDSIDRRVVRVKDVKNGKMLVRFDLHKVSNVTYDVYYSQGGNFKIDVAHFEQWCEANGHKEFVPRKAPVPAPLML